MIRAKLPKMKSKIISILFSLLCFNFAFGQLIEVSQLKTDYRTKPLGFDNPKPEFSWIIKSSARGTNQTSYEILVSDNLRKLENGDGNSWKSGKMMSGATFGIPYNGNPLKSFTRYYWKVRIADESGKVTAWSEPSWFETSMMKATDWTAKWISDQRALPTKDEDFYKETPNPLLRKNLILKNEVKSARLYIAGLGYFIAYINGQRVGNNMLDMPWTQYGKQVIYNTFDVTSLLSKGENAIGVMLGNGWYNPMPIKLFGAFNLRDVLTVGKPCVKAQLRITFRNGTTETIVTDQSWKAGEGPILTNSVYLGEKYDARLEQNGWNKTGFDDKNWTAVKLEDGPKGQLIAQYIPPIRATQILKPVKITEPKPGVYLFDFGQNFAGVPRLKIKAAAGTTVIMRGGEDIHPDGTLNYYTVIAGMLKEMWNLNGGPGCPKDPINTNTYICKGNGDEVFTPEFTFSSFRYVEVTGLLGKPNLDMLEGVRMNADLQETGSFECSNAMFNKIQDITKWTFLSNVFSIQSDCPAREKLGYGADIVTTAEAFSYNYDMSSFYRKVVQDFVNDVRPNGGMPEIAPNVGINSESMGGDTGSPGWQLAFPYGMKVLHDFYGDIATVKKNYEMLKKQVDFMHSVTPTHIVEKCISDHASLDEKPVALSATAFYYHHVLILIEFAKKLNKTDDLIKYQALANDIKAAFVARFLKAGTGVYDNGTQAAQLIALNYNLVPENERSAVVDHLMLEIFNRHKGHLSTGIFATKFLFDFFRTENRNDVAYTVANQREFPGWGNMLANGATTLYENWVYPDLVDSQNHPMFGSISEWFYRSLLGINPLAPGFTNFEIKPQPTGDLTYAKGYYDAVVGRIVSYWKVEGTKFKLNVIVPANTTALIYVPSLPKQTVLEGNKPAENVLGLKFIEFKNGCSVYQATSGNYAFESKYQK